MALPLYMSKRWLCIATCLLTITSVFPSFTLCLLKGMLTGVTSLALVNGAGNVVIIYDYRARTPLTGIVPLNLVSEVKGLQGVVALSPEVVVPCMLNGKPVIVRGITASFSKVEGLDVKPPERGYALVGSRLAAELGLSKGNSVILYSAVARAFAVINVEAVVSTGTPLDDEVIVDLKTAQWLRGVNGNYVTFIKVLVAKNAYQELLSKIGKNRGKAASSLRIIPGRNFYIASPQNMINTYLERFCFGKSIIISIATVCVALAMLVTFTTASTLLREHSSAIRLLRMLGAPKRLVALDITLKMAPLIALSSTTGFTAAYLIVSNLPLAFLHYYICGIPLDVLFIVITANFISLIAALKGID